MAQPGARATHGVHVMGNGCLLNQKNTTVVCESLSAVGNTMLTFVVRHAEVRDKTRVSLNSFDAYSSCMCQDRSWK